jgi:DNA-binding transcriptional LysR family regulator
MFDLRNLDLNLLTVFEAIYDAGSINDAADRLDLSPSAIKQARSRLRAVFGDQLFVRGGKALSPTPTAKATYPIIKQALEAFRTSLAEAAGFDASTSRRHFRLAIPHPMGPFYALDMQNAVAAVAPGIVLTFDTVSRPLNLEGSLREGIVDVAIDWLPVGLDPFVNRKIFEDRMVIVARKKHPRIGSAATIESLGKERFIGLHRRRAVDHMPQALRKLDQHFHEIVRVSELLEIPTVVASTDLLGLMPSSMAPLMEERLGLQVIAIPLELPTLPIYMIWHETRRGDAAHAWLREVLAKALGPIPRQGAMKPG